MRSTRVRRLDHQRRRGKKLKAERRTIVRTRRRRKAERPKRTLQKRHRLLPSHRRKSFTAPATTQKFGQFSNWLRTGNGKKQSRWPPGFTNALRKTPL